MTYVLTKAIEMETPSSQTEFLQRDRCCIKIGKRIDYVYIFGYHVSKIPEVEETWIRPILAATGEVHIGQDTMRWNLLGGSVCRTYSVTSVPKYIQARSALKALPPSLVSARAPTPAPDALSLIRVPHAFGR